MMSFRKISAASVGKLIAAYFTESKPDPIHDFRTMPGKVLDSGDRLTSYYTSRDSRASWRPDLSQAVAEAMGVDGRSMPKSADLARLFEAKRADTGEAWSEHERKISSYDLTLTPHKSIALAIEFARTPAEAAMLWHIIDLAADQTMRYVAREVGWARKGRGGENGADPGQVGWVSFRHTTSRPIVHLQDGEGGTTQILESQVVGDPLAHVHNVLFNLVVADDGRVRSLDTRRFRGRIHEFGGFFQARVADGLRRLGIDIDYDEGEQAIIIKAVPQHVVDAFSTRTRALMQAAKQYATENGLDWATMSLDQKNRIIKASSLAGRAAKAGNQGQVLEWQKRAAALGWTHDTVLNEVTHGALTDRERHERAYAFAARHLAREFVTAAVIDADKLRTYAVRGLIGTGIAGGIKDIDRVVELIETRGIDFRGERVALVSALVGDKIRVTNTAQLRIEESLAAEIRRAAEDHSGALSNEAVMAAVQASGLDFRGSHGKEQLAAIRALGEGGSLSMLTGLAGSGKTTLLQPLVRAWKADTRFEKRGREIIGAAIAWRQADALLDAGVSQTMALSPFLKAIKAGEISVSRNTVLVVDEISQVAPRQLLTLLELQRRTGMTIKVLGDREQAQSIEAGDVIELLRRMLPKKALPELLSTVRQTTARNREIATLFRGQEPPLDESAPIGSKRRGRRIIGTRPVGDAGIEDVQEQRAAFHLEEVRKALNMKREDGTARMIGGDHDEVLDQIADLYMTRRDHLRASGGKKRITVSALTNQDAADISGAIRNRMRAREELGRDEIIVEAVDQRGETYNMPIAAGDRIRLYRRTWGRAASKLVQAGSNGDIVEVIGHGSEGLRLRSKRGLEVDVGWKELRDEKSNRILVGWGHAMTIDASQGMTSDEHINALPRGVGNITGFTAYVAESRSRGTTWTMIAEGATLEAVRRQRAIGDITPIGTEELWEHTAKAMAAKPYKSLAVDLLASAELDRQEAAESLMRFGHLHETDEANGRKIGREIRMRAQASAVQHHLPKHIAALDEAIRRGLQEETRISAAAEIHLRSLRIDAEEARRALVAARPSQGAAPRQE